MYTWSQPSRFVVVVAAEHKECLPHLRSEDQVVALFQLHGAIAVAVRALEDDLEVLERRRGSLEFRTSPHATGCTD